MADLIAAGAAAPHYAEQFNMLLKILRDGEQPPAPIKIEVLTADQMQAARLMVVKRDDNGKVSGAVIESAPA